MLSLIESNWSVSVWMPNIFGYWQDWISLLDPPISGTPEMGCLRPFVVTLEKSYCFVCSHCLQSTSKPHWIHMTYKQSLIQFCCQKVHMHVKKCQLAWEVWAWPGCSLHMTKYCCKQSEVFTTGHSGVCRKKAITQRESLRQVSANLRGLSLTRLFFTYDKILLQAIQSIHNWSCRCYMKKWFHNTLVIIIQQISTNRSAMASNTPAFKAALTRILFTNKATEALIGEDTSLGKLKSLSSEDIKTLCKVIREDTDNEITFMNQKYLDAMRVWV